jgi:hypothetical protein
MNTCKSYEELSQDWKDQIGNLIGKMCGKSNIADVSVAESDLEEYKFKVTVCKFNTVKGWATIGYIRQDRNYKWVLTYKPRRSGGEKNLDRGRRIAGRTGSYG